MVGSTHFIILAASLAICPYSTAVLCPICQGPSISLPRHHILMPSGSFFPFLIRMSLNLLPPLWFAYSTISRAFSGPRVPRLMAYMISLPTFPAQSANSCRPTSLLSVVNQARSSLRGRWSRGPTESSQLKPETKFPPGYRIIGTPSSRTFSITSFRKPASSAFGWPGS